MTTSIFIFAPTDQVVDMFARACPRLRWVGLDQCLDVTDTGVTSLCKHCPDLDFVSHAGAGTSIVSVYTLAKYMAKNITLGKLERMAIDLGVPVEKEPCKRSTKLPFQLVLDLASMAPRTTHADFGRLLPLQMEAKHVSALFQTLPKLEVPVLT